MENSFDKIYNPNTLEAFSIYSNEGKALLKALVSSSMFGGLSQSYVELKDDEVQESNEDKDESTTDADKTAFIINSGRSVSEKKADAENPKVSEENQASQKQTQDSTQEAERASAVGDDAQKDPPEPFPKLPDEQSDELDRGSDDADNASQAQNESDKKAEGTEDSSDSYLPDETNESQEVNKENLVKQVMENLSDEEKEVFDRSFLMILDIDVLQDLLKALSKDDKDSNDLKQMSKNLKEELSKSQDDASVNKLMNQFQQRINALLSKSNESEIEESITNDSNKNIIGLDNITNNEDKQKLKDCLKDLTKTYDIEIVMGQ